MVFVFRQKLQRHGKLDDGDNIAPPPHTHTIKIEFRPEPVTSFGGLILAERLAGQLRLWNTIVGELPSRRGRYDWLTIIKSTMMGLLSGAQGTFAAEPLRQDAALRSMLSLPGAPEEATLWRSLEDMGEFQAAERSRRGPTKMMEPDREKKNRGEARPRGNVFASEGRERFALAPGNRH